MRRLVLLWALLTAVAAYYFRAPPALPGPCADTYRALFARDPEVLVVFGYKDARPARFVGDLFERALLVQELERQGFARAPGDDDRLTKKVRDPDGHARTLNLRVINSAVGADDRANRLDPEQKKKSAAARAAFLAGLARADVVIYNGHARVGGGPDFAPPRLTPDDHVDYAWYKKTRPGLVEVERALAQPRGAKLVGLFACDADAHFAAMSARKPAIVSEDLIYFADSLRVTFETIENLAALKCEPDFSPAGTRTARFFSSRSN